jgi:hypothetical protein
VINYYEDNLPGFIDNVNEKNVKDYTLFKNELLKIAKTNCKNENSCFKTLLTYVEFFKDNHSKISQNNNINIDENNSKILNDFFNSSTYKNHENIANVKIEESPSIDSIVNIYESSDKTYKIAIVKNKNYCRDYVGIIIDSKTPLWKKGQVKLELKSKGNNYYDIYVYLRNYSISFKKNVLLKDGKLNTDWYNIKRPILKDFANSNPNKLEFNSLNEETNYIYIPTMLNEKCDEIKKFIVNYDSAIQSKPHLIIDLRNNGGGNDDCARPLLKYLYTNPILEDSQWVYRTNENLRKEIELYDYFKKDTVNSSDEVLHLLRNEIERMKDAPDKSFILRSGGDTIQFDETLKFPKKITILSNRGCGSSCESILVWSLQSKKTTILGENSAGYTGYGDVTSIKTPNFKFKLSCTLTRSNKIRQYEEVGIPPNIYLTNKKDWIEQALEIIKNK